MTVLMVSCSFPEKMEMSVHGIFQRMNLFIEALMAFGDLEILFYVPSRIDLSDAFRSRHEKILSKHFGIKIRLSFCHLYSPPMNWAQRRFSWTGFFSIFRQPTYIGTSMPKQVRAFENCLQRKPNAVFVQGLKALCPVLLSQKKLPPLLFDVNDIPHILLLRSTLTQRSLSKESLMNLIRIPAIYVAQQKAVKKAQATFTCSVYDKEYLEKRYSCANVIVAPNSVEIPEFKKECEDITLLFIGSYGYQPNVFAAEYLINRIWPKVRKHAPNARLILAGKSPENIPSHADRPHGVDFPGFIDDLERLYEGVRIVCVPIFAGGGTRIKILEAAAYGKPIVTTSIGAEGISMKHGKELLICDKQADFIDACALLINDSKFCDRLGKTARDFVVNNYDRKKIIPLLSSNISKFVH